MRDALMVVAIISIGTVLWVGMQTAAWMFILRKGIGFATAKGVLLGAFVAFPVFILIIGALSSLAGNQTPAWELVIAPVVCAYTVVLSIAGLHLARRILEPGSAP